MRSSRVGLVVAVVLFLVVSNIANALQLNQPGYTIQQYATYSKPGLDGMKDMTFDDQGNLYAVHYSDSSVWRITPSGNASAFVSGLYQPDGIEWTGQTAFGDYLYVTNGSSLVRVSKSGIKSDFGGSFPTGSDVAVDRTGNYGGNLFVATGGQDHIYYENTAGDVTMFSNWPDWTNGGGPDDIAFDNVGNFGSDLYIASYFGQTNASKSGIFKMDASGNATRFTNGIIAAWQMEFDKVGLFNHDMFVFGKDSFSDTDYSLWRIKSDGTCTEFGSTPGKLICGLTCGDDGALYIGEYSSAGDIVTINRVIPEPATLSLLALGGMMLRRRCSTFKV
jgi:hypothetical protein